MYTPLGKFLQISQGALLNAGMLRGGRITSQELIIAGGANGVIRSQNFDPTNELGWGVFGDGSASFYGDVFFGKNAIFQGDLHSSNWDGTIPPNLSSVDAGATKGFALDSSEGAAQFMGNVFLGGTLISTGGVNGGYFVSSDWDGASPPTTIPDHNALVGFALAGGEAQFNGDVYMQNLIVYYAAAGATGIKGSLTYDDNEAALVLKANFSIPDVSLWFDSADGWYWGTPGFTPVMKLETVGGSRLTVGNVEAVSFFAGVGSAASPSISFTSDPDTGMYRSGSNELSFSVGGAMKLQLASGRVDVNDALRILDGSAANPAIRFVSDTNTGIYRHGTDTVGISAGNKANLVVGGSGVHVGFGGTHTSGGSGLFVWDLLKDIGNHEVLRADRGTGTGTTEVGYFSSWEFDPDTGERRKEDIVSLVESPRWNREWFYKIRPVDFRRISTGEREFGFLLDEWKATADDMKYLTTKGDRWGSGPHETALLAATILEVQDHERRIRELEAEVAMLRGEKEKHA